MVRVTKRKDPLLSAAVLKVSLVERGELAPVLKEVYEGVLRDFEITDEQVDAYIEANRERVARLVRGEIRD